MAERVLLDTNAVIFLATGAPVRTEADILVRDAARAASLYVSPVSAWEIGNLARPRNGRPRLDFMPDPATWFTQFMQRHATLLTPLTVTAAAASANLPEGLNADPADRLLTATAREIDAVLVTRDHNILTYAGLGHLRAVAC